MDSHRCWAEIDLEALARNARIARVAGELMAVVKADAYGHGIVRVAQALAPFAAFIAVASAHEALELKPHLDPATRFFILGPALPEGRAIIAENAFVPSLSTLEEAENYNAIASQLGRALTVHLAIDTGMGRMGFTGDTLSEFLAARASLTHLDIEGVCSHFPSADEDPDFTLAQIDCFHDVLDKCRAAGLTPKYVHIANSAGLLGFGEESRKLTFTEEPVSAQPGGSQAKPASGCNFKLLNRPGLMLYGVSPLPGRGEDLTPVLTLKSRVTLVRDLPAGRSISYGRTFITSRESTRVATLGIGYGDGYPRHLSGAGAEVLIGGRRCPLLGRVTMDQILVDVTDAPSPVVPGDESVLIGRQGNETIPAAELAERAGTIPWEIFTGITRRVPRIYLENNPDNPVNPA